MRSLERIAEPDVLSRNKVQWTKEYIDSGESRPKTYRYRHKDILRDLCSISSTKCFYCEMSLKGQPSDVEHNVEVSSNKNLAYEWSNLYLSCKACNTKVKEAIIPHDTALDPFVNSDEEIKQHITFHDEIIHEVNGSILGDNTIRKYHLDSLDRDYLRLKKLQVLYKEIDTIKNCMINEGRQEMTIEEKDKLKFYAHHKQEYSLMCEMYLRTNLPEVFEL